MTLPLLLSCLLLSWCPPPSWPGALALQEAGAPGPAVDDTDAFGLPPAEPPPGLSAAATQKLKRAVKALRNRHAATRAKTERTVIAIGRAAIPELLSATATDHEGKRAALLRCLLAVAGLDDRTLVAECLDSEREVLRHFGTVMAGRLALPRLLDALPARLEDSSEAVRSEAALALVSHGREEALPLLVERFDGELRERIVQVLPGLRDRGDHALLVDKLKVDAEREQRDPIGAGRERANVTRMLAVIGDEMSIRGLAIALEDSHNVVQREAIDGLRRLLEGQGPFVGRSVFQQVREVERLRAVVAGRPARVGR